MRAARCIMIMSSLSLFASAIEWWANRPHDDLARVPTICDADYTGPSLLVQELSSWMRNELHHPTATSTLYSSSAPFNSFCAGYGNPLLYSHVVKELSNAYSTAPTEMRILDIGVGMGRALLPSLDALDDQGVQIDLIEPCAEMLASTRGAIGQRQFFGQDYQCTLQQFAMQPHNGARWDIAQATFALHNLSPDERFEALTRLRPHIGTLLLVEFDVPPWEGRLDRARIEYVYERYERALKEEGCSPGELAVQGFLMPIMTGYFQASTSERPIDHWIDMCRQAGFNQIDARIISKYWWAPAFLITAS